MSAANVGTSEIMSKSGKSKTSVWRWQERFMLEGIDGLLRDTTRPSRIKLLVPEAAVRGIALTPSPPPGETIHWIGTLVAKETYKSASRCVADAR